MHTDPYRTQSVTTAGPAQLVLLLFDGALAAIARARRAGDQGTGHVEAIHRELQRAQDILFELQSTLDHERGGDLADHLGALYGFCLERLLEANLTKDLSGLAPVERVVTELRDGWAEACCGQRVPAAS